MICTISSADARSMSRLESSRSWLMKRRYHRARTKMAISFFQKLRLMLRGRARRREERDQEFLRRNVAWAAPPVAPKHAPVQQKTVIDREGLQVAFLDDSG